MQLYCLNKTLLCKQNKVTFLRFAVLLFTISPTWNNFSERFQRNRFTGSWLCFRTKHRSDKWQQTPGNCSSIPTTRYVRFHRVYATPQKMHAHIFLCTSEKTSYVQVINAFFHYKQMMCVFSAIDAEMMPMLVEQDSNLTFFSLFFLWQTYKLHFATNSAISFFVNFWKFKRSAYLKNFVKKLQ